MSGTIDFLSTSGPVANVGDDPRGVTTVDVNGDGKIDLVTSNGQGLSVAIGDGAGGFSLTADFNIGKQVLDLRVADLNGDGKADIVASGIFGDVQTFQGNGDGTFGAATPLTFGDDSPRRPVTLADVNADGRIDFVSGIVSSSDGVMIRYNIASTGGAITFDEAQVIPSQSIDGDVVAADVNGDGKFDVVGLGNDGIVVLLNTGNDPSTGRATFGSAATYATTFLSPTSFS